MTDQQYSYRQIFKSTSLFGGVQVIIILISMVRTKFVAVLLGTVGVGTLGLLNAPLGLITAITGLGISYSAVRDISEAAGAGDERRFAKTLISFRRWVIFTGLLGMIVTVLLSPWLSRWTFGNSNYTWAFVWISVTLLLNAISGGQRALLQGMRKFQSMAKATVIGSILGLFTSIPLYYLYGNQGIIPALIISAFVALLLSWYFARQVPFAKIESTYKESFYAGMSMIKLGIILSISSQIGALVAYLVNAYIARIGGLGQVGLYTAGVGLIGTSVGLVFTAMGTDYYPKLAAVNKDNAKIRVMVNQQAILSVLIIMPIVLILLTTMPFVIRLILSKAFIELTPFVNLMVLGVLIKAVSYSIGYISFAKGDSKVFFWLEGVMGNVISLLLSLLFYKFWGLNGMGIAFIANYLIYLFFVYQVVHRRYGFSFEKELYTVLSVSVLLSMSAYLSITFLSSFIMYIVLIVLTIIGLIYSYHELNKRMNIKPVIFSYVNKFKKNNR